MDPTRPGRRVVDRCVLPASGLAAVMLVVFAISKFDGESSRSVAGLGPPLDEDVPAQGHDALSGLALPSPAPSRAVILPAARYSIGPTRRVDARLAGAQSWEPSIVLTQAGAASADEDELAVVWMEGRPAGELTDTRIALALSFDGGVAWTTSELIAPAMSSGTQFDPMTALDPDTGRAYIGAMSRDVANGALDSVWLAGKDASAAGFEAPLLIHALDGVDKGWMAAGSLPAPQSGSALYVIFKAAAQRTVGLRSLDGGATFAAYDIPTGIGHQPRVASDGALSISFTERGGEAAGIATLVRSLDALQTFSPPLIRVPFRGQVSSSVPGEFRIPDLPMHAVDPMSGRLYLIYNDVTQVVDGEGDVNLLLRDSIDDGVSWSAPRIVNGDGSPPGDQVMPWIECDEWGRLHLAYFDNRRNPASDVSGVALLDVYYAMSTDGGTTWEETRLTTTALDGQSTWWNPLGYGIRFVGDYLGLAVSRHAAYVAYPGDDAGEIAMMVTRIDLAEGGPSAHGDRPIPERLIRSRTRASYPESGADAGQ